jgi:hypothetical protein
MIARSRTTPTRRMSHLGNANGDCREDDQWHDRPDEHDKAIADRLMSTASFGKTAPSRIPTPMAISTFT